MDHTLFATISLIFTFITFFPYLKKIITNQVTPHYFSWLIWFIAFFPIFLVQFSNDAGPGSWAIGFSSLMIGLICIVSYFKKTDNDNYVRKIDYFFLFLSFVGVLLWLFSSNQLISVIILTFVALCGYIPSMIKLYVKPFEEDLSVFILAIFKNSFSLLAIDKISAINIMLQISIIIASITVTLTILFRRILLIKKVKIKIKQNRKKYKRNKKHSKK